jgi:hypothetical protein
MSERISAEWQELLDEYGMTDEEVDDLFDQPWPGQYGYEDDDPENDPDAHESIGGAE